MTAEAAEDGRSLKLRVLAGPNVDEAHVAVSGLVHSDDT